MQYNYIKQLFNLYYKIVPKAFMLVGADCTSWKIRRESIFFRTSGVYLAFNFYRKEIKKFLLRGLYVTFQI